METTGQRRRDGRLHISVARPLYYTLEVPLCGQAYEDAGWIATDADEVRQGIEKGYAICVACAEKWLDHGDAMTKALGG